MSLCGAVRAVLAAAAVLSCATPGSNGGAGADGPKIPLDTDAVRRIRIERLLVDSALRGPDTSSGSSANREWARAMADVRLADAQEVLARLGYGVTFSGELDSKTKRAITEFAQRHGLPFGDSLTPQIEAALKYAADHTDFPFALKDLKVETGAWDGATVHAVGTWSPADPPRQTSNIWCYRNLRLCRETVAYVAAGELYTDAFEYDIDGWDTEELTAHASSLCQKERLMINRSHQSAVLVRSALGAGIPLCENLRSANKEALQRLVSGRTVTDSLSAIATTFLRLGPKAARLLERVREYGKPK